MKNVVHNLQTVLSGGEDGSELLAVLFLPHCDGQQLEEISIETVLVIFLK